MEFDIPEEFLNHEKNRLDMKYPESRAECGNRAVNYSNVIID